MKRILTLILSLLPLAHAAGGGYATPAEFGYPALSLEPAQHLIPAPEREWSIPGQPPLRATLQGIKGKWGNDAIIIFRVDQPDKTGHLLMDNGIKLLSQEEIA